ncbi:alpha/beta fold hydrolase [Actinophytocola sp.]|uniref:alpha/beta fold hydrolase n=1 Tax=Actinophytocola sp. TaxID=1872138 RepID=UPI003D6A5A8F
MRRAAHRPIGTLLFMPGGPDGSGVSEVIAGDAVPAELAARFDVVSFDPHGTNGSNPVRCDADLVANPPDANPEAGATFASVMDYSRALGRSCREHTGSLVDHVDSVSVARDMDAVRAALGERRLWLYGRSYGTLAGQMYAERFPSRVRALVLDSVFDHSLTPAEFLSSEAATGEDSFGEFAAWCAATPSCAVPGRDARAAYDSLYRRSIAGELAVPPMELVNRTVSFFYEPEWPAAAEYLPSLTTQPRAAAGAVPFPMGTFCADHRVRTPRRGRGSRCGSGRSGSRRRCGRTSRGWRCRCARRGRRRSRTRSTGWTCTARRRSWC